MNFDLTQLPPGERYRLLINLVVPRPIALVTSQDAAGVVNAAPFSYFNLMGSDPPIVALGVGDRAVGDAKDTAANIRRTGEFVVNLVDEAILEAMNVCAIDFPPDVDELAEAGLTAAPSGAVRPPRIAEAVASLECRLSEIVQIGQTRIILGEVIGLHVRDGLVVNGRVQTDTLHMVGRLYGGAGYTRTTDTLELPRMTYAEWRERVVE